LLLGLGAGEGGFVDLLLDGLGAGVGLGGGAGGVVEFSLRIIFGELSGGGGLSLGMF